ncbi:Ig-like domain-containing protein [Luteolibacter flavescens]|uniref:Ig-like domain-containing protein n=1 Tax=Luteolibacter flavescens TaxID=1859460 RepID=A0ABT3FQW3_9BACT|nr:Ig-like domain-containing protein [Luteolibacter flavescens]MCW1885589.1 Ig-like domain-containing protein [Luteolibacter flavescens]
MISRCHENGRAAGKLLAGACACLSLLSFLIPSPAAADGPGLGNVTFAPEELLSTVARFEKSTGAPHGHGFVSMHKGYLVVPFSLDGGGGFDESGFAFYDVSDPRAVRLTFTTQDHPDYATGSPNDPGQIGEPHGYSFTRFGGRDYVCVTQNIRRPDSSGLQVWDFTEMDVPAPTRVSRMPLPGLNGGDYAARAWWVFWQGGRYAYVAGTSAGLYVVDLSDPASPVLVSRRTTSELGFANHATNVVFAVGNLLVVTGSQPASADAKTGIATFDISDPANPVLLDHVSEPAGYSSMLNGHRIYTTRSSPDVWNISDPTNITLEGEIPNSASKGGYGVVQDNFFLYGASNRYRKIDVGAPPFTPVQTHAPSGFGQPDWDFAMPLGNLVFMGNDHSGSALIVHQTEPDTTGPVVNMVNPAPDSLNRAVTSRVGLTFTDAIDLRTVDSTTVVIRPVGGQPLTGRYSHQTGIVNFWPDEPLEPDTAYQIHLPAGGVKDWAGNGLATEHTSLFSTGTSLAAILVTASASGPATTGEAVNFTATAEGQGTMEYSWDFGDGTPATAYSSDPAATHTYDAPGHYAVTVQATNGTMTRGRSLVQTVHRPLMPTAPVASSTILHLPDTGQVWCVNPDADTVTAIDASTFAKLHETPVGRHPRTLARAPDGDLWVVNQEDATISVLATDGTARREIALPRASRPYGIAFSPDGSAAWVTTEGTGELLKLHPATGEVLATIMPGGPLRGIAIGGDPARIFVTRFLSSDAGGEVHEIDPATIAVVRTIPLAPDAGPDTEASGRGIPNYLSAAAISPDGHSLWLPSKKDNIARGLARDGQPLTFESTVRTIVSRIDLATNAEIPNGRIDFNDRDMAQATAFSPRGDFAFIALQGSNSVDVIDAYSGDLVSAIETVGRAPQGLAIDPAGGKLYVQNFMDRTIAVHDVSALTSSSANAAPRLAIVPTVANEPQAPDVLLGKRIFYDATDRRMNHDGYISCASCHLDGGHDARTWDFTDRGEGLRNTTTLHGRAGLGHGRVHWTANFDEIQDFEHDIRDAFGGSGFLTDEQFSTGTVSQPLGDPKAGLSADLDALAAYVSSLTTIHPSPHRSHDGSLTAEAVTGKKHFDQLGCYACHGGSSFTDSAGGLLHAVGAAGSRDTPTLKGLWETPPYLHDGSAATLADVFMNGEVHGAAQQLSPAQRDELAAYLLQLGDEDSTHDFGPLVRLTEPVNGALYAVGAPVTLAVHVTDFLGPVASVEYLHGMQVLDGANSPPFTGTSGDLAAGDHSFHARIRFASGLTTVTGLVTVRARAHTPLPTVRVNFQPASAPIPEGYLVDSGEVFGDRGNGWSYGWNAPTTATRDRNSSASPDQRYDTLNHLQNSGNPDAVWEIELPNGGYRVHIVSGDAIGTSGNFFTKAEEVLVVNGVATSAHRWVEGTQDVALADGRLTVRSAPGAAGNKICFIDIEPLGPSTAGTAVSLAALAPATAEGADDPATIRISRAGKLTEDLAVRLGMSGTAQAGMDFAALPDVVTIPAGAAHLDLPVTAVADPVAEGEESVTLSLLDDPGYVAGESTTATVMISDPPFDAWRFASFRALERADPLVSGFESVPFPGGIANGLAYALGLDPAAATPAMLPRPRSHDGRFALSFKRPAGLPGVSYQVESSTTLAPPWQSVPPEDWIIQPHEDGTETIIVRDPLLPGESPGLFLRLKVTPE